VGQGAWDVVEATLQQGLGFEDFYREERPGILRSVTFTVRDPDLALEVTDEAFARACERWGELDAAGNRQGWVYRVAINLARNRWRRLSLERRKPPPAPPDAWIDRCADPALARALEALPIDQRAVVVLRYHLDWSVADVAAALDIAPGTVKSRLHRALRALAAQLADPSEEQP
jgi:RNA polymerase sigma-70 factor (ECF subfamily)